MCTGFEIAQLALPAVMSFMGGSKDKGSSAQAPAVAPATAPPASQAAKTPSQATFKNAMPSGDPTALTGPGGIPADKLLLGKATVLGA